MMELEHVGIAIADVSAALAVIEALLGEVPYKRESLETDRVRTHFIRGGGAKLELLEALEDGSPVARFLQRRGPGLHHLAFEVDDVLATHHRLREAGFRLLDDAPRAGADGKSIFFVHPEDTGGVLFEFCRRRRPVLETFVVEISSDKHVIRRAGQPERPALLVLAHDLQDIDAFAAQLEQSMYVLVADGQAPNALPHLLTAVGVKNIHLVATPKSLARVDISEASVRSTIIFVDQYGELPHNSEHVLFAARSAFASDAIRLRATSPNAHLVIADDDELFTLAIEKHVRAAGGR